MGQEFLPFLQKELQVLAPPTSTVHLNVILLGLGTEPVELTTSSLTQLLMFHWSSSDVSLVK